MNNKSLFLISTILFSFSANVPVFAQSDSGAQASDKAPPAEESDPGFSDIVVTANKREQRLNDTGITVSVVGGDALKQQQLGSLADVAQRVPGLSFANAPNGTPVYTLRGVGFYESSIGAYPAVSIYVDEAPLPFPVLSAHSTYDLERIEVLKGPQGTLFGQNATGGAINYIASKPTDSFEAGGSLSYGRFNEVIGEAYVSGPISETLKARLAGRIEHADGWQQSNTRPGERNGKKRNYMGRFLLAYEPSQSVRFLLNVNAWQDSSETQAGQHIALQFQNDALSNPPGQFRNPDVAAAPFSPARLRAADWSTGSFLFNRKIPFGDTNMLQSSLRTDIDVGDAGTFTALTSYVSFNQRQGIDSDGLAQRALDIPLLKGRIRSFSQEVRFANSAQSAFRFVVGANFQRDDVKQTYDIDNTDATSTAAFGALFGFPIAVDEVSSAQLMKNYAAFANVEYDLVDNLTLKLGARYTKSTDRAAICQSDPQAPYNIGNLFAVFGPLLGGPARGPYVPGECFTLNQDLNNQPVVDYLPHLASGEYRAKLSEDNVSWRAGVDYKVDSDTLLYLNVSKGYKAGSFPAVTGSIMAQFLPVTQESVVAYEGGIKAALFDRIVQFNAAAFYYDYTNKQLRSKLKDPTFGQLDALQNVPKSSVKGFELELGLRPLEGLAINAAYTYLDAKIDRFTGVNASGETDIDFAGTRIPFTPKHQIGLNIDYGFPVTSRLDAFAGMSVNYRSNTISTIGGDTNPSVINATSASKVYGIDAYTLVDGQLGVRDPDGVWSAYLWGKNIFNKYYWTNVVSGYDTIARFSGAPSTYGITFRYNFK